jgi:hypothetical protein
MSYLEELVYNMGVSHTVLENMKKFFEQESSLNKDYGV